MVGKPMVGATLLTALAACSVGSSGTFMTPGGSSHVQMDPVPVLWAAADVFERAGIPVAEEDELDGEVRSGTFRVERTWGGEAAEARIRCGPDEDALLRAGQVFDVSMIARVRSTDGSSSHVVVVGTVAPANSGGEELPPVRCTLREDFRSWVEEEIVRAAQLLPSRPRMGLRPDW